jgi:hypothetical protein
MAYNGLSTGKYILTSAFQFSPPRAVRSASVPCQHRLRMRLSGPPGEAGHRTADTARTANKHQPVHRHQARRRVLPAA